MQISQWMKHSVVTVKPGDSIAHAREVMEERRVNQLPVVSNGHLVGIVTDRDLRDAFPSVFDHREKAKHAENGITVQSVMTTNVITLRSEASMTDAARLMRRERIGAMPILEGGVLIGILTRSDVLDAFVSLDGRADDVPPAREAQRRPS